MSTRDAQLEAQKLAYGPMMFQALRAMRELRILDVLKAKGAEGLSEDELHEATGVSVYGLRVLLEAGLVGGVVSLEDERWALTKVGYVMLVDPVTQVTIDFVHDVCYRPGFHLLESIREGRPVGLKEFGDWPTVYEALPHLPEHVRESWFAFDHFSSDTAFDAVLPIIFEGRPGRILDVGGNTGRFAERCCAYDESVEVTIVDLPGQVATLQERIDRGKLCDRIKPTPCDVLDSSAPLPAGHRVIWMSQFLDCFSEEEIVSILTRAAAVMDSTTSLFILETFWDLQRWEASRYNIVQTSLYFTAVANGNSKMYHSDRMRACVEAAGLVVATVHEDIGIAHSMFECKKPASG